MILPGVGGYFISLGSPAPCDDSCTPFLRTYRNHFSSSIYQTGRRLSVQVPVQVRSPWKNCEYDTWVCSRLRRTKNRRVSFPLNLPNQRHRRGDDTTSLEPGIVSPRITWRGTHRAQFTATAVAVPIAARCAKPVPVQMVFRTSCIRAILLLHSNRFPYACATVVTPCVIQSLSSVQEYWKDIPSNPQHGASPLSAPALHTPYYYHCPATAGPWPGRRHSAAMTRWSCQIMPGPDIWEHIHHESRKTTDCPVTGKTIWASSLVAQPCRSTVVPKKMVGIRYSYFYRLGKVWCALTTTAIDFQLPLRLPIRTYSHSNLCLS